VIICGDALEKLKELAPGQFDCCVTSPPYWGLRDYKSEGQLGLEPRPEDYVDRLVGIFREVRRVLKKDGTLWLNMGDCYVTGSGKMGARSRGNRPRGKSSLAGNSQLETMEAPARPQIAGLKPKDLAGIPWRVAFALQADGWWLRQDIIWSKPNPMPESVVDRPTKSHEYIFLLAASEKYHYDAAAIREPASWDDKRKRIPSGWQTDQGGHHERIGNYKPRHSGNKGRKFGGEDGQRPNDHLGKGVPWFDRDGKRNKRSVWTVTTKRCPEAHFSTFPEKLIEPCILAGCQPGGVVLDPFFGAGTTGIVALRLGRNFVGIELNPDYVEMAQRRIYGALGIKAAP
jgi:DNA modification methylase